MLNDVGKELMLGHALASNSMGYMKLIDGTLTSHTVLDQSGPNGNSSFQDIITWTIANGAASMDPTDIVFDIPADSTVNGIILVNSSDEIKAVEMLSSPETYTNAGTYKVTAANLTIGIDGITGTVDDVATTPVAPGYGDGS